MVFSSRFPINDRTFCNESLELLDKQAMLYTNTVPRGAQTWEIPCAIRDVVENDDGGIFTVDGWGDTPGSEPYCILVSGWKGPTPYVTVWPLGQESGPEPNRSFAHRASVAGAERLIIDVPERADNISNNFVGMTIAARKNEAKEGEFLIILVCFNWLCIICFSVTET